MNFHSFQLSSLCFGTLISLEHEKKKTVSCQLKMTSSVQHSDGLFGRRSGFPDGVGEVNAHASENLNSASG